MIKAGNLRLFCIGFVLASALVFVFLKAPLFYAPDDRLLEVKQGESLSHILITLERSKVRILLPYVVIKLYFYITNSDTNLKAGFYQWNGYFSLLQFKKTLEQGKVLQACFTLIDGSRTLEVINALERCKALRDKDNLAERWKNHLAQKRKPFEGQLLAETYCFPYGESAYGLLIRSHVALENALKKLEPKLSNQNVASGIEQRLIIASLIEKESNIEEEKKLIASVIINRLKANMLLQIDSSVLYGLGLKQFGKGVKKKLAVMTPYNTYKRKGLPPTPIANVGLSALNAAFEPIDTNFYYFVLDEKLKKHVFSENYREHLANIKKN